MSNELEPTTGFDVDAHLANRRAARAQPRTIKIAGANRELLPAPTVNLMLVMHALGDTVTAQTISDLDLYVELLEGMFGQAEADQIIRGGVDADGTLTAWRVAQGLWAGKTEAEIVDGLARLYELDNETGDDETGNGGARGEAEAPVTGATVTTGSSTMLSPTGD